MTQSNESNKKREMGYHGSGMHGYSMHTKEGQLDRFAGNGTKEKEQREPGKE